MYTQAITCMHTLNDARVFMLQSIAEDSEQASQQQPDVDLYFSKQTVRCVCVCSLLFCTIDRI